ncbi:hypothetical protein Unana1_01865 [Umbelopsis nana]
MTIVDHIGAILSNLICGVLLIVKVLGGLTPILYTLDWSLASYLIIKQMKGGRGNDTTGANCIDVPNIILPPYQRNRTSEQSRIPLGCTISTLTCDDRKIRHDDIEHGERAGWEF